MRGRFARCSRARSPGAFALSVPRRRRACKLDDAERILIEAPDLGPGQVPAGRRPAAAGCAGLEFDLVRYLRHESRRDGEFEPAELEYAFETEIDGVTVRGRIDRVDTWNGHALVRDYKSGKTAASYRVDAWETENRLQAPLYMLAAQREQGLEPAGAVYVPLAG